MEVVIVGGYGDEKEKEEDQRKFLKHVKKSLRFHGMPVDSISSKWTTGGPIILSIPKDTDPNDVVKPILSLATELSKNATREKGEIIDIGFDVLLPGCAIPMRIIGSGF